MKFSCFLIVGLLALSAGSAPAEEWKLVWSDEFDRDGLPDPARWTQEHGLLRNHERQFYTRDRKENARVENGVLVIEARKEPWGGEKADGKPAAEFTSASLTTQGKAAWTRGRVEVRAKLPKARGTWPAVWMLGSRIDEVGWPRCGELDIMEHVGYDPGVVHANTHTEKYNHVKKTNKGNSIKVPTASDEFHVYSMEWDAERITFFVDGREYFTFENEKTGEEAWPFDQDHYLILNLAVGGDWGGRQGVDEAAFPQRYEVDYVRIYQKPGDVK